GPQRPVPARTRGRDRRARRAQPEGPVRARRADAGGGRAAAHAPARAARRTAADPAAAGRSQGDGSPRRSGKMSRRNPIARAFDRVTGYFGLRGARSTEPIELTSAGAALSGYRPKVLLRPVNPAFIWASLIGAFLLNLLPWGRTPFVPD